MGVSKNNGTPKWMVKIMENLIKMDDLGVPLFLETPISQRHSIIIRYHFRHAIRPWISAECLDFRLDIATEYDQCTLDFECSTDFTREGRPFLLKFVLGRTWVTNETKGLFWEFPLFKWMIFFNP